MCLDAALPKLVLLELLLIVVHAEVETAAQVCLNLFYVPDTVLVCTYLGPVEKRVRRAASCQPYIVSGRVTSF